MFVFGQFIIAATKILDIILTLLGWVVFIRAILSWVNPDPYNFIVQFLYKVTEPILSRIRLIFRMSGMGLDISPVIAILIILFLRMWLIPVLYRIGASFL